jgi:ABC-type Zn2+ transport system substrate-binding protein/surface adhesin
MPAVQPSDTGSKVERRRNPSMAFEKLPELTPSELELVAGGDDDDNNDEDNGDEGGDHGGDHGNDHDHSHDHDHGDHNDHNRDHGHR